MWLACSTAVASEHRRSGLPSRGRALIEIRRGRLDVGQRPWLTDAIGGHGEGQTVRLA